MWPCPCAAPGASGRERPLALPFDNHNQRLARPEKIAEHDLVPNLEAGRYDERSTSSRDSTASPTRVTARWRRRRPARAPRRSSRPIARHNAAGGRRVLQRPRRRMSCTLRERAGSAAHRPRRRRCPCRAYRRRVTRIIHTVTTHGPVSGGYQITLNGVCGVHAPVADHHAAATLEARILIKDDVE